MPIYCQFYINLGFCVENNTSMAIEKCIDAVAKVIYIVYSRWSCIFEGDVTIVAVRGYFCDATVSRDVILRCMHTD